MSRDTCQATGSETPGETADRPGLATVYEDIAAMDCVELQETFDRNMDRYEMRDATARQEPGSPGEAEFAYAQAAQERIEELGC